MTRGIDNNNPGNIRKGISWEGLDINQTNDEEFAQFISPEYGIRAIFKILHTYKNKYGLENIHQIINRWAPPSENDTEAYISFVEDKVGVHRLDSLTDSEYPDVVQAIIHMENGEQPYPLAVIIGGQRLA